eukprot:m.98043 g.98043  ORF g.98043 m.98043 type:complete len:600 (-) comp8845_c0_seq2:174-1973(-)
MAMTAVLIRQLLVVVLLAASAAVVQSSCPACFHEVAVDETADGIGTLYCGSSLLDAFKEANGIDEGTQLELGKCLTYAVCGDWAPWTSCNCAEGTRTRMPNACCCGPKIGETTDCCCPVDGGWSAWSCGGWLTSQTRECVRECNNPVPACGGLSCDGESNRTERIECRSDSAAPYIATSETGSVLLCAAEDKDVRLGGLAEQVSAEAIDATAANIAVLRQQNAHLGQMLYSYAKASTDHTLAMHYTGPLALLAIDQLDDIHLATGDLDGDSDMDILFAVSKTGRIAWLRNDGLSWFSHMPEIDSLKGPLGPVALIDLDGDGDLDIVASFATVSAYISYTNDGTGGFTENRLFTNTAIPTKFIVADFSGDGVDDLLVMTLGFGLTIYNRTAPFQLKAHSLSTLSVRDACAFDMNGDGRLDVVVAAEIVPGPIILYNDGFNADVFEFTQDQIASSGMPAALITAGDFDGDGKADVAWVPESDSNVLIIHGQGAVGFDIVFTLESQRSIVTIKAYDVGANGVFDLYAIARFDSVDSLGVGLFKKGSSISINPFKTVFDVSDNTTRFYLADLDGDGDLDPIAVSSTLANTTEIRWSRATPQVV